MLAALPLTAQFSSLATDDTGSRVWFSTPLRLRGTDEASNYAKIFSADAQGNVVLAAQTDGFYDLINPEASGDGAVFAYTESLNCTWGNPETCWWNSPFQGVISTVSGPFLQDGIFHLSRNGRYVMHESYYYEGPTEQIEVIDLASMQSVQIPVGNFHSLTGGGRQVSSSGAALAYAENLLWLFQPDGSAQYVTDQIILPAQGNFSARAALDDAGDLVVFQSSFAGCAIAMAIPFDLGAPSSVPNRMLVNSPHPCTLQGASSDASKVLLISQENFDGSNSSGLAQAWTVDAGSAKITAATHDPAGIADATISADGNVVWASTFAGRMVRVDLAAGAAQEIIPQTILLDQPLQVIPTPYQYPEPSVVPLYGAPGMLVHVTGSGLAVQFATSTIPLGTSLAGAQVLVDGEPVPLLSVSPTDVVFQVPWESQTGGHVISFADTPSPFEGVLSRSLWLPGGPAFWPDIHRSVIHQDFRGPVWRLDPARPDEILHIYVTGMGPVTPPVGDGQPGPFSPLSVLQDTSHLGWAGPVLANGQPTLIPANLLFVGLAPGLVGIEQIDVQVPHTLPPSLTFSAGGADGVPVPVAP